MIVEWKALLVAIRANLVALCVVLVGVGIAVTLPLTFPGDGAATDLDRELAEPIHSALDEHPGGYEAMVIPSNGYILIPLLLAAAAWFGYRGQWRRAVAMVAIPEVVVGINSWVLKPLWDRPLHDYLAYPSGHTVHLVAIATAFVMLTDSTRARVGTIAIATAALVCAAVGMIGLGYHLPTDILGGTAVAIALVVVCWKLTERFLSEQARVDS
ncbi:phosphatase PAP2 family protein [Nocardia pseudovaccinii]|uniref:phosphatase PAP2 family protein n=1 Tax=Nocardia pseudovaccinii TaxID=189540 RepID=UPI001FE13E4D|nr:phosphatase PAP2 family protein [Nocardia pseudovaccinii]